MSKQVNIGLFGFGCVGSGLFEIINKNKNFPATIKKIVVKNPDKPRSIDKHWFSYHKDDILNDPEINLVVELIDDADAAFELVKAALENGKHVVSANKKMIAENFETLLRLQKQTQKNLLYEAAVCGAIPIIRTLEEYYNNEPIKSISGVFNGTTNYILTKIEEEGLSYEQALDKAKRSGFAEANSMLDVQAFDPKYKLSLVIAHAFGIMIHPKSILNIGIEAIHHTDIRYAGEKGLKIKLMARAAIVQNKLLVYVIPEFVNEQNPLYQVTSEYNGICLDATFSDTQFFRGRGAGSLPTASAVLSDISAIVDEYNYKLTKLGNNQTPELSNQIKLRVYLRYTYSDCLIGVDIEDIEESFTSLSYKYVIGKISLDELNKLDLNNRNDVFVAVCPENYKTNAEANRKNTKQSIEFYGIH